ncbi:hypothetical protein EVAR_66392_1 [Eumeta japonica]|uniref:Uncharacterized protein n=1 Tax=Eumeta variegata TaxID=151549 RepID=A0A4C1ZWK5_EUMVA|nr:hypothetical protein EVAR_66392_1 [Eumeta japonica]
MLGSPGSELGLMMIAGAFRLARGRIKIRTPRSEMEERASSIEWPKSLIHACVRARMFVFGPMRYHAITDYRREVAISAVGFRPVNESSDGPLPSPSPPHSLFVAPVFLLSPHFPLHQLIPSSIRHPILIQESDNVLVTPLRWPTHRNTPRHIYHLTSLFLHLSFRDTSHVLLLISHVVLHTYSTALILLSFFFSRTQLPLPHLSMISKVVSYKTLYEAPDDDTSATSINEGSRSCDRVPGAHLKG